MAKTLKAPLGVYALDLAPADVSGPLSPFPCSIAKKESTYRLINSLNTLSGKYKLPAERLKMIYEIQWPVLVDRLKSISSINLEEKEKKRPKSFEEKLDEALEILHSFAAANKTVEVPLSHGRAPRPKAFDSKPRVFVSSSIEGLHIAESIQADLEPAAECTIWTQDLLKSSGKTIENIVNIAADFDCAIIVLTPDDMLAKKGVEQLGPRDNMVFELGLFTGTLGRARTFMVLCKDDPIHLPADLVGVTVALYSRRSADNLAAALKPVCTQIKRAMGTA
ncbi:MAG: nucleotide-binding protein [Syntrophotaleaceae bacterium]